MKAIAALFFAAMLAAGYSDVLGQAPPGAGDKMLEDRNIKGRSVELERIKKDAAKPDAKNQPQLPAVKFQEIKEDFERIQLAQDNVVTLYTRAKVIDFAKISENAGQINKRGLRLKENLFPPAAKKDGKKSKVAKEAEEIAPPRDMKMLIVDLDNALAAFTGNPMFTNPQVVNADSNAKAQTDLEKVIRLSSVLQQEADKASKQKN
jgi:hypothetical protein